MSDTATMTESDDEAKLRIGGPGRAGLPGPRVLIAALVALVLAGGLGWWWFAGRDDDAVPANSSERAAVLTVARQVATNFFTLDHTTVEEDIAAVSALATGDFADAYAAQAETLTTDVRSRELVVTATLPEDGTAVESLTADAASVLVSVDATSTPGKGAGAGESQMTLYRVRVTLTRTGDGWLASRLDQVEVGEVSDDGDFTAGSFSDVADDQALVQAATDGLAAALSYDYRDLDGGLREATDSMTDTFAASFGDTFTSSVGRLATDTEAVADAVVRGAGVVRHDGGSAAVLVYVDQVLVSSETTKDTDAPLVVNQSRVVVEMREVDGTWLIDGIQPF